MFVAVHDGLGVEACRRCCSCHCDTELGCSGAYFGNYANARVDGSNNCYFLSPNPVPSNYQQHR